MINTGDTAFMILCTAMVCLMTPGLAFFYGGLTRRNNVLSLMMKSFISMGIVTVMWIFGGFGLVFGRDLGGVIGNPMDYFAMQHITFTPNSLHGATIPFLMFFAFQLMFCVITVPLMTGAFSERMTMRSYVVFLILWNLFVYFPVAHWIWGGGFLQKLGFIDFAGGAVIHTTAGFGALMVVMMLGQRKWKVTKANNHPSNLMAAAIGTGLLWFGWFGFNSGGAFAANKLAATAFTNTFVGLAVAMVMWMILLLIRRQTVTFVDVLTGSVAGLATVTPCAGYITPTSAIIVGIVAACVCQTSVAFRKHKGWDDALDVWGVHGMGGLTGIVLVGILANQSINGVRGSVDQTLVQIGGILLVVLYTMLITWIIVKLLKGAMKVELTSEHQEYEDADMLGQTAYDE